MILPDVDDRVKMIGLMPDDPNPIPVGTEGTVIKVVPEVGQIYVHWDNGSKLILLTTDPYKILHDRS